MAPAPAGRLPAERTYEIRQVAALTGLTASCLRAWERRFSLVRPERQANGYRAYSSRQVALLRAFARLTQSGYRIGDLVGRPWDEVILEAERRAPAGGEYGDLIDAILALDRDRLARLIGQEVRSRGLAGFADQVVPALATSVGDLWALGLLPVAGEHLASELVLQALKDGLGPVNRDQPLLLAAGLPSERHEWGLLSVLIQVQEAGWSVCYLGPDLPLPDLLQAAWKLVPSRIALTANDSGLVAGLAEALAALPSRLPSTTSVIIGGNGIATHSRRLADWGYELGTDAAAILHRGGRG